MGFGRIGRKFGLVLLPLLVAGALPPVVAAGRTPIVQVLVTPASPIEGQSVVVSASITDTAPAWDCLVEFGDGQSYQVRTAAPVCVAPSHLYATFGSFSGGVTVTQVGVSLPQSVRTPFTVGFMNVAPTLADANVHPAKVGDPTAAEVGISDPGSAGESYVCSIDWGDGTAIQTGSFSGAAGWPDGLPHCTFMGAHAYAAAGTYPVTMRVLDQGGLSAQTVVNLLVTPLPASIGLDPIADQTVQRSGNVWPVTATLNITDPWPNGQLNWTVAWGDGNSSTGTVTASGPVTAQHNYLAAGTYSATADVVGGGAGAHRSFTVTAAADQADQPPVVFSTVTPAQAKEPQTVVASATFTDPDSTSWTCEIVYGDNTFVPGVIQGNTCTGPAHRYAASGTYIGFVGITDNQGQSGSWTFTVTYTNAAPSLSSPQFAVSGTYGQFLRGSVAMADPGSSFESYTCTVDYGDGSPMQPGTYQPPAGNVAHCVFPDHQYAQAGDYQVTMTVADSGGAQSSVTATAHAVTVAPVLNAVADQTLHVGTGSWHLDVPTTLTDPNLTPVAPYTVTIEWGDGGSDTLHPAAPGDIPLQHDYAHPGTYLVTVTAANAAAQSSQITFQVTNLLDGLGVVTQGPDGLLTEGVPVSWPWFIYDQANPGPYDVTLDWGDGTVDHFSASDTTATPSHTYHLGDLPQGSPVGIFTVTMTVKDSYNQTGSTSTFAYVENVVPVLTSPNSVVVPEGVTEQVTVGSFTDASLGPWTVLVNWPTHSSQWTVDAPGDIVIPIDGNLGSTTIQVAVVDRAGGYAGATVQVTVPNAAPVVDAPFFVGGGGTQPIAAGATFTDAAMAEPGSSTESYVCAVDYGDGAGYELGNVNLDLRRCEGPEHVYAAFGTYQVSVVVIDSAGDAGYATGTYTQADLAPVVQPVPGSIYLSEPSALEGLYTYFTDPDSGAWTCSVDYGDGTTAAGTVSWPWSEPICAAPDHHYLATGIYTGSFIVTDDEGQSGSAPFTVFYENEAPWVGGLGLVGDVRANHPSHAVAAVVDAGAAFETYTCTSIDYGDGSPVQAGTWVPDGWSDGLPRCVFPDHSYASPGTYVLTAVVTDGGGATGSTQSQETIIPEFSGPVSITGATMSGSVAGSDVRLVVTFADAGLGHDPTETYSCAVAYGDSTGAQTGTIDGNQCLGPIHQYATGGTYTAEVFMFDSDGTSDWRAVTVEITSPAAPKIGTVSVPASTYTGTAVTASATYTPSGLVPADTCSVDYGDGSGALAGTANGTKCTGPAHSYASAGTYTITVTILATNGTTASGTASIVVSSLVGAVSLSGNRLEGSPVTASAPFVPTGTQAYNCKVDYGDGSGYLAGSISGTTCKGPSHKYGRGGSFTVTVRVTGSKGYAASSSTTAVIENVVPYTTSISLPSAAKIGTPVTVSVTFADPGTGETYTALVDWNDGTRQPVSLARGAHSFTATHTYLQSNEYPVVIELSDDGGAHVGGGVAVIDVFDPARSASGSGTFASPAGACTLTTKCGVASTATFAVSAAYPKPGTKPNGSFTFTASNFTLSSTGLTSYIVQDGIGVLAGTARVNGVSGYRFGVLLVDGSPDKILITVVDSAGNVVYYNQDYTPLKTGSITLK